MFEVRNTKRMSGFKMINSSRMHFEFVKSLQIAIQKPFETLEIDFFEIAALKSLLLVSRKFRFHLN